MLADLRAALPADGIVACDVGAHHNWIVQEWRPGGPGTLLQSWGFAAMCFGVAGALGAKLAAPDRSRVRGRRRRLPDAPQRGRDRGRVRHPCIWLVWNNGGYMSIRDQQQASSARRELATTFRYVATEEPYVGDFAAMARSMGAEGIRAETPADLGAALKTAHDTGRPTVIDVPVAAEAQPSAATWDLPPLPLPQPSFGWPDPANPATEQLAPPG